MPARRSSGDDILLVVRVAPYPEQRLSAPHEAGKKRDEKIVHEIPLQERLGESGAPAQHDILPGQGLEPGNLLPQIPSNDP